ncbi:putative histone acetyltransferase chromatin regulator PHD family [Medicago truncatula]|uniref:Putative histone acetyltransferase chromatin regulator PHD family n=1 Tax=Medicago truncatula TaxID=3880 RepID=G7KTL9_MEDTR|nr:increased DNA methylation 1 [Medicago truncatula]AES82199.1 RING/FYVE/PHD zinc finger protein [Medicago truncatula]RHN49029.1 putative histone acetyltransferase chromatin regulator PHD family [Medicago truncatula]
MDSRSPPPHINIEPEYCPQAVFEWYRLTGLKDRKESFRRKDLALKAKQHLFYLGWRFWYIDKKCRWELRYTSPNAKNYTTLRKACHVCIEQGGCSLKHSSTAAPISSSPLELKKRSRESHETAAATIFSSALQLKKRQRKSKEAVARAFTLSALQSKERPGESEETAATSIYLPPLQSKEQLRKSEEAATTTAISSSPLQLKVQPRESEEAVARAFSLSPLQSKERLKESKEEAAASIYSSQLHLKEQPRESEEEAEAIAIPSEFDESTSDEDSEASSTSSESTSDEDSETSCSSSVKKATVTMVSTTMENENHVSQSEPEVTNSVGSGKKLKVLKTIKMEKNLEGYGRRGKVLKMSIMKKNSEGFGKRGKVLKRGGIRESYSIVSWLIENKVLVSGTHVFCRGSENIVKRGSIFSDGIVCNCCRVNFTVSGFEAHAGCTRHRPSISILLEDGRSLFKCQREARDQKGSHCIGEANSEANNDNVCSICGFGGDLVLCDRCPSAFHLGCLGLDRVPDGDWFCPTCCCKICYRPKCKQECADGNENNFLVCVQCEQKFHFGCVKTTRFGSSHTESNIKKKNWFCSVVCGNMFLCLKKLLGKPIKVADNINWTLLKNVSSDDDGGDFTSNEFSQEKHKLNAALGVLYEGFNPTIDALSGRELIKDLVFSRDSEHKRLNFRGFYTVILEKMGEVISVATIRIFGQKVAEIVFVATKEQHRGRGMCRLLMDELEEQLTRLGVGRLVLHSSEDAINTWTKSFGFARMTSEDKCKLIDNTFLEFHNSIMCLKPLNIPIWPRIA